MRYYIPIILLIWNQLWTINCEPSFATHKPLAIPNEHLEKIKLSNMDEFKNTLDPLMIERIVGTDNHAKVRNYIIDFLKPLGYSVELDSFEDDTPNMGKLTFHNIIAKLNPEANRYLMLACHYDSKYMKGDVFLGAIDSAVPCAMLLHMADRLQTYLEQAKRSNLSLMLVFFDGEEAFQEWGPTDSIYGSRHLAAEWEKTGFLSKIDLLILLDLLGAPDPALFSFFSETDKCHMDFVNAESRLSSKGFLNNSKGDTISKRSNENTYFQARSMRTRIEDDHIPFLDKGVPIVHVIPVPFPDVWHTINDNQHAIDNKTVADLSMILHVYVLEYLHINVDNKN